MCVFNSDLSTEWKFKKKQVFNQSIDGEDDIKSKLLGDYDE